MRLIIKIAKCLAIIIIIIAIPIAFNLIFKGDQSSAFFFIHSSMSVSDWFAFWIAYISVIISSFLAYAAINLSETIERAHEHREAENNKQMFYVENTRVVSESKNNDELNIEFLLPNTIHVLDNVRILNAKIKFGDGSVFNCVSPDGIKGDTFKLVGCKENNEQYQKNLLIWLNWNRNMTIGFETICVDIVYYYELKSFNANRKFQKYFCETKTTCHIKAPSSDQKKSIISNYIASVQVNKCRNRSK